MKLNRRERRALKITPPKTQHIMHGIVNSTELILPSTYVGEREKQALWSQAVNETRNRYLWLLEAQARALEAFYVSHAVINELVQLMMLRDHLPDEVIRDHVKNKIESVTGSFNELVKALEALGTNLSEKKPLAYSFIENITTALDQIIVRADPRAELLHSVLSDYVPTFSSLETLVRGAGRDPGMDVLTLHLGSWGDRLVSEERMSYAQAAEHILEQLTPVASLEFVETLIRSELSKRDRYQKQKIADPATGKTETVDTRQKYLKGVVYRYRHGNSRKVV